MSPRQWLVALGLISIFAPAPASAQAYPSRPIMLVVPFAAGGPIDIIGRLFAPRLSSWLGQPVVIDNRGGAGSTIGTSFVANAQPDGYTLLLASNSGLVIAPHVYKNLSYDPVKSFAAVSLAGVHIFGFAARLSLPAENVKELVEYARSKPGQLNYGSSGIGTGPHLLGEAFKSSTGIQSTHVPFKGGAPAVLELVAGRIDYLFEGFNNLLPYIRSGKIKALAIVSSKRTSVLPDVPTMSELGIFESVPGIWSGVVAPAGTPAAIVQRVSAEVQKLMATRDIADALLAQGIEPAASMPGEFASFIQTEHAKWGEVVRTAGVKAE
jgi:tripartite-type tricarboxylate transporter receptor subunit TctC